MKKYDRLTHFGVSFLILIRYTPLEPYSVDIKFHDNLVKKNVVSPSCCLARLNLV